MGAEVLRDTLALIKAGQAPRTPQDPGQASYYPMLKKETGLITWGAASEEIRNLCRALDGGMGAYTLINGEKLKIFKARAVPAAEGTPGEVLAASPKDGLVIRTGDGALDVLELQLPGRQAHGSCGAAAWPADTTGDGAGLIGQR